MLLLAYPPDTLAIMDHASRDESGVAVATTPLFPWYSSDKPSSGNSWEGISRASGEDGSSNGEGEEGPSRVSMC